MKGWWWGACCALAVLGWASRAQAQACCAGGTVLTPARLAIHEDWALGGQVRARSNPGSFTSAGEYRTSGAEEQVLEQDVAGSVRLLERAQVGILVPVIETHRRAGGVDDWGGGLGDVSVSARYDVLLPTETLDWPGVTVLGGATLPTGRPPEKATHLLAADATGEGTFDASLGLGFDKAFGQTYVALDGWLTHRFAHKVTVPGAPSVDEAFGLRATFLVVVSYVFANECAIGVQVSAMNERKATINGEVDATTGLRMTTVGVAGVIPIHDDWRVQGSLFSDVMLSSFGKNEPAGHGLTAALVKVWL